MKQLEKDIIIISCIATLSDLFGEKITDHIPNFDKEKFYELAETISFLKNDESIINSMALYANECYKRVSKKFKPETE